MRHWIWHNEKYLKAWIYCLFRANHTDNKVLVGSSLTTMKPGEFITSINHFAKDTRLSMQEVRTFWMLLINDKMINKESTNNSTKITICHYIDYQNSQQTGNKPITNQQQTNNKPATTDKNVKKYNNLKNGKNIPAGFDEIFIEWYQYKDERKDYYTEIGMEKHIVGMVNKYHSAKSFRKAVDHSMSMNYKGIYPEDPDTQNDVVINDQSNFDT